MPKIDSHFPRNVCDTADLPAGFIDFLRPLHEEFTPKQTALTAHRRCILEWSAKGIHPDHLESFAPTIVQRNDWQITVPDWCKDQRNQMTGPADDAELCVKMLNSGAPGVMLDLEDSMANTWSHTKLGVANAVAALHGKLTYFDKKKGRAVGINQSTTVVFTRVRGLHMQQHGVFNEPCAASVFDAALLVYQLDVAKLKHPICLYIPKSESLYEAVWWSTFLKVLAIEKGLGCDAIKCMALVEAHPLAYEMEEFLHHLRHHILGLNLGRWDYMASLGHFMLHDSTWVLPDRNTIPHDVPFFQNLRTLMVELCHKRGALAIGGMTALFPSRSDAALNTRALAVLEQDKKNEAALGMDGAWTGHPDQNAIAVAQFPAPNQLSVRHPQSPQYPDLRPELSGVGKITLEGTRAAVRTVIRYRHGVLSGKGASLLDGYMEDLATDRIYRVMLAQRIKHAVEVDDGSGVRVKHTEEFVAKLFQEELSKIRDRLIVEGDTTEFSVYEQAAASSLLMIVNGEFDPT